MPVNIRRATLGDVYALAPLLRQADRDECWASHHAKARDALLASFLASRDCWAVVEQGNVIVMFGVAPLPDGGMPWLLGSDRVERLPVTFYRRSRVYLGDMLEQYGMLVNYIDVRNTASIAWLRWLGFSFDQAAPYGAEGLLFQRFWMRRDGNVCSSAVCNGSEYDDDIVYRCGNGLSTAAGGRHVGQL